MTDDCMETLVTSFEIKKGKHCYHWVKVPNPYYVSFSAVSREMLELRICCRCGQGARSLHHA